MGWDEKSGLEILAKTNFATIAEAQQLVCAWQLLYKKLKMFTRFFSFGHNADVTFEFHTLIPCCRSKPVGAWWKPDTRLPYLVVIDSIWWTNFVPDDLNYGQMGYSSTHKNGINLFSLWKSVFGSEQNDFDFSDCQNQALFLHTFLCERLLQYYTSFDRPVPSKRTLSRESCIKARDELKLPIWYISFIISVRS